MKVAHLASESNGKVRGRQPRIIIWLLLPLLLGAALSHSPAQAAVRKHAQRPAGRWVVAGHSVSQRRRHRRKAAPVVATHPAPSRAEVEEDSEGRRSWFLLKRAYPFKDISLAARRAAWAARPKSTQTGVRSLAEQVQQVWTPLGPAPTVTRGVSWGDTSGRINAVAVSPINPRLILVGASTGGIWRSTDGGTHFAPVSDDQVDLAVSWITFAPSNPAVVYAGMGDIDYEYLGSGVLKSTDGGQTWARVSNATLPDGVTARLEVDPTSADRVYLAQYVTTDRATNLRAASGLFVSTDGGVNWTRTLAGQARDVVIHPANPQVLYAGLAAHTSLGSGGATGLYRSADGGNTWTNLPVPTTGLHGGFWDFRIAVTPADPQRVYIYYGTIFFGETRFQVSFDGGATWQARNASQVDSGQFGYNTYLFVDPTNADAVYLGAHDLFKSADGGASWTNMTKNFTPSAGGGPWTYQPGLSTTHSDQQGFAFEPGNPSVVYLANDGGLWKSTDSGATLQSLNTTLSLVQFNSLALHPTDAGFTVGGTQDNGTQRRLPESPTNSPAVQWDEPSGSDGGACVINPVNPSIVFGTYYAAWVNRFRVSPTCFCFEKQIGDFSTWGESTSNTRIAFYPPLVGNGVDQTIYFGTWRLFKSGNLGDSWLAPAPTTDLTKGGRDVLSAIAVARSDLNVIYTGSAQGRAMISNDGGGSWRDITAGLPNRFIESIVVAPGNPAVAYLSVSGYGSGHVFKTTDAGQSWADVSGNLPNIPTGALLIDPLNPQTLYAGTDVGVFRSTAGGSTWETFNNGLPPVAITAFAAQPGGRIQVATYGRGAYELTTRTVTTPSIAFGAANYQAGEGDGLATITVTRSGDTSAPSTVGFATVDDPASVPCNDTTTKPGVAFARCDYATTVDTISFTAGQTTKVITIPLIDDVHVEGSEAVQLQLVNPSGAMLGPQNTATLTIKDNDTTLGPNPIFTTPFFVRQQYLDFLSREPEQGEPWSGVLNNCSDVNNNPACDRLTVSAAFFGSPEFRLKGYYVYRFYKLAFGRLPLYGEIIPDMRSVTGPTATEVYQKKANFAQAFVQRAEFVNAYGGLAHNAYVAALMGRYSLTSINTPDPAQPDTGAQVTLTGTELTDRLNAGTLTRAQVLRAIADSEQVFTAEFNQAFVAMQYYGYLRRTPESGGYNAWLNYLNTHPGDFRTMVNGFMNSQEYRLRFGNPNQ